MAKDIMALVKKSPAENEYVDFKTLSVLVIDDINAMRSAIRNQLHVYGIRTVTLAVNAHEALNLIKANKYDLILCDYNLNQTSSGQHFLEHLRNERLLSATTIFVMLTAETEYGYVASAVEFTPDDYILKPYTEAKLRKRLERLLDRRAFLMPVLVALDEKRYDNAIAECNKLLSLARDERQKMEVLRRKSEAQLAMQDHASALETFSQAKEIRGDAPWVMMGLARCYYALGELEKAAEVATQLIGISKNYISAYEFLAQIRYDQGNDDAAHDLLESALKILPSAKRYRSVSQAAFLMGRLDEAKAHAEAAIKLSIGSIVERSGDFLSLAQTLVDMGDYEAAVQTLEKNARKHGEVGIYGVAKNAILAQAYFELGDEEKAKKLLKRSMSLQTGRKNSFVMTALGKAALKSGDLMLGLKMLTQAVQSSGKDVSRISRHVKKSLQDTGHHDKVEEVIDGGQKRILSLVDEATALMRSARFEEANKKVNEALAIQDENVEALITAAQLQLLWLKLKGMNAEVAERAKGYLATLDKLVPSNPKVMNLYRFYSEIVSR